MPDVLLLDPAGQLHIARPGPGDGAGVQPEKETRCGVDHQTLGARRVPSRDLTWEGADPTTVTSPGGARLCDTCEIMTRREHLVPRDQAVFDGVPLA